MFKFNLSYRWQNPLTQVRSRSQLGLLSLGDFGITKSYNFLKSTHQLIRSSIKFYPSLTSTHQFNLINGHQSHRSSFTSAPFKSELNIDKVKSDSNSTGDKLLTPSQIYNHWIKLGKLNFDPFQAKVVEQLDQLQLRILEVESGVRSDTHHKSLSGLKPLFKLLLNLSWVKAKRVKHSIYLFGSVGTGKTMLMDLFYSSLPPTLPKRRVHFHAFMIEVHQRLHRLKKENPNLTDPIVPLAADVAREARVLCFDELQVTDIADAMILRRLFSELFGHGISILTTSNRHPDELYKDGLQRSSFIPCIQLLKAECQVVDLDSGVDYRRLGKL